MSVRTVAVGAGLDKPFDIGDSNFGTNDQDFFPDSKYTVLDGAVMEATEIAVDIARRLNISP